MRIAASSAAPSVTAAAFFISGSKADSGRKCVTRLRSTRSQRTLRAFAVALRRGIPIAAVGAPISIGTTTVTGTGSSGAARAIRTATAFHTLDRLEQFLAAEFAVAIRIGLHQ